MPWFRRDKAPLDAAERAELQQLRERVAKLERVREQQSARLAALEAPNTAPRPASGTPLLPGYRSPFGGLWPDRLDAGAQLAKRRQDGRLDETQSARLQHWTEHGYVILEGAVSPDSIDAANEKIDAVFASGRSDIYAEYFEDHVHYVRPIEERHRDMSVKVLDLYVHYPEVREILFAAPLTDFLHTLFEQEALAFQSLYFRLGSEQPMHQDTVYVGVQDPLAFVGVWVALEDIEPESGELLYYPGSHRFEDYLWDAGHKRMPPGHKDHDRYLASLHEQAEQRGIEKKSLLPKKGDVMIWHADLAHGGAPRGNRELTRRSIVTHYCPLATQPTYFEGWGRHSDKLRHESGGFYCFPKR